MQLQEKNWPELFKQLSSSQKYVLLKPFHVDFQMRGLELQTSAQFGEIDLPNLYRIRSLVGGHDKVIRSARTSGEH
jgi:hypothetical protein